MKELKSFNKEYQILISKIKHINVDVKTLVIILEYVLDIVENIEGIKGNKKKNIAILLISKVVENANLEKDNQKLCNIMIEEGVIGDTIDLVINAHNGKLDFGQLVETGSNCCITFLKKKKKKQRVIAI